MKDGIFYSANACDVSFFGILLLALAFCIYSFVITILQDRRMRIAHDKIMKDWKEFDRHYKEKHNENDGRLFAPIAPKRKRGRPRKDRS